MAPAHGFRLVLVELGKVVVSQIVFEGKEPFRVGGFFIDVRNREVAVETEPGRFERGPADW